MHKDAFTIDSISGNGRATVTYDAARREIYVKNDGKCGIFGAFIIRPTIGPYGFSLEIHSAVGDVPFTISHSGHFLTVSELTPARRAELLAKGFSYCPTT